MTNFAQPVSMECTEEQYNIDLKDGLEKLGYVKLDPCADVPREMIVTRYYGANNQFGITSKTNRSHENRHFIDHYNPSLFLAIAGMREGEDVHVGEWMICLEDVKMNHSGEIEFTKGILYISEVYNCLTDNSMDKTHFVKTTNLGDEWNKKHFRKATLSELITHFTKKDMIYTLEDLRDGKVACVNDGTSEQLKEVVNLCFPNDREPIGRGKYYFSDDVGGWLCEDSLTQKPTQSVKLFHSQLPKEHEFKFGDKVLCWDDETCIGNSYHIFLAKVPADYPYLVTDENDFIAINNGSGIIMKPFKHCEPFAEPLKITRSEIAEKFGTDHFEIVE